MKSIDYLKIFKVSQNQTPEFSSFWGVLEKIPKRKCGVSQNQTPHLIALRKAQGLL